MNKLAERTRKRIKVIKELLLKEEAFLKKILDNIDNRKGKFPDVLADLISEYTDINYELLDWVPLNKLYYDKLLLNPKALSFIEKELKRNPNGGKISWEHLSMNPEAIKFIEDELQRKPYNINWWRLSGNPAAIHLLEKNPEKIDWDLLSSNPAATKLLEKNQDKIKWEWLSVSYTHLTLPTKRIV